MPVLEVIGGLYRILLAAIYFTLFGIGGMIIALFINILHLVFWKVEPLIRLSRLITRYSFKIYLRTGCLLGIFKIDIQNAQAQQSKHGCIYIANHPSLLDIVIMVATIPHLSCYMKSSITKNFFMRAVVKCNRYIAVDGDTEKLLQQSKIQLQNGDNLIIFPEGTRTADENHLKFTHGFANIAQRGPYVITPVVIRFCGRALKKNTPWYYVYYKRLTYQIRFLDDFNTIDFMHKHCDVPASALSRKISFTLQEIIKEHLKD